MPLTGYLEIPNIDGESQAANHEDEIDVFDVIWDISRASSAPGGSGRARGRAVAGDFAFRKFFDQSSPFLAKSVADGTKFDEIKFAARKLGGSSPFDYLTITLENCVLTGYEMDGPEGVNDEAIVEKVMIAALKMKMHYVKQSGDGNPGSQHEAEFEINSSAQSSRPILSPSRGFATG